MYKVQQLFTDGSIRQDQIKAVLTCFVGCKLTITTFPPNFLHLKGKLPLGTICKVVPRHILISAKLKEILKN